MLKETANHQYPLYAKAGCQHRGTYTATKLQLLVYKDAQCSQPYGDEDDWNGDGYDIDGYFLSNKVSFRPPFYSCQSCKPDQVASSFSKQYSPWYDDDYIAQMGERQKYNSNDADDAQQQDDANQADDGNAANYNDDANAAAQSDDGPYYQTNDDTYLAYDDANNGYYGDDANQADDGNQ